MIEPIWISVIVCSWIVGWWCGLLAGMWKKRDGGYYFKK